MTTNTPRRVGKREGSGRRSKSDKELLDFLVVEVDRLGAGSDADDTDLSPVDGSKLGAH